MEFAWRREKKSHTNANDLNVAKRMTKVRERQKGERAYTSIVSMGKSSIRTLCWHLFHLIWNHFKKVFWIFDLNEWMRCGGVSRCHCHQRQRWRCVRAPFNAYIPLMRWKKVLVCVCVHAMCHSILNATDMLLTLSFAQTLGMHTEYLMLESPHRFPPSFHFLSSIPRISAPIKHNKLYSYPRIVVQKFRMKFVCKCSTHAFQLGFGNCIELNNPAGGVLFNWKFHWISELL